MFYVSYDGIGEPLGRSQVLAYLERLCREFAITLVSFEKPDADLVALGDELARLGISWLPLRYHRQPPVLSTLRDVLAGVRALRAAARAAGPPAIVHVRSDVPALIAMLARRSIGGRVLFDIRGFWADERVEGGLWPAEGWLYRLAKRCERWFYAEADAVVTLTETSVAQVREWVGPREVDVVVIPTCVDLDRFATSGTARTDGPHAVWCGSIGTWYRFDLVAPLAAALGLPLDVITRQPELAHEELGDYPAAIRSRAPQEVARELACGDVGLCLVASSFSKRASAPTRFGEYLAAGMPVIVTRGVGDLESLVAEHGVGVVLDGEDAEAMARAASAARALAADAATSERCRELARACFDVERGSRRYAALYRTMLDRSTALRAS